MKGQPTQEIPMTKRTLALVVALLLVVAACGTDADADGGAGETTTVPADDGETTTAAVDDATTTSGAEEETAGVHASDTELGTILVDEDGFTLYVFTNDTGGESSCYDDCATTWPPVAGDTAIGSDLDTAMFGTTARTDGDEQLTVNGQPLYRYTPDANPGDTTGQGVGGVWFVVGSDGAMIEGPEASSDTDDGVDY
jgi:predicted lipoprotein with Yx(FWY)xxD motif